MMKFRNVFSIEIFLILFIFHVSINAENQIQKSRLKTVEVTGVGLNKDLAIKDALNSAVRQVSGIFLRAEETTVNDNLKSEIYTYSAGAVKEYRDVKFIESKGKDALVHVSMEVDVYFDNLFQRLKAEKVLDGQIDGNLIAFNFKVKKELHEKLKKQLVYLLESFPDKYLKGKILSRKDVSKLGANEITLSNEYQIEFDQEKFSKLLFYLTTFLERISEKSGILTMSKTKDKFEDPFWKTILGKDSPGLEFNPLPNNTVKGVSLMHYQDSENPTLKNLPENYSIVLVFDPSLETPDWLRWRWYQIPKIDIEARKITCFVKFNTKTNESNEQLRFSFNKNINGLTRFPISHEEKATKNFSGIAISPFFFDYSRFANGFRFTANHTLSPEKIENVKSVSVSFELNKQP